VVLRLSEVVRTEARVMVQYGVPRVNAIYLARLSSKYLIKLLMGYLLDFPFWQPRANQIHSNQSNQFRQLNFLAEIEQFRWKITAARWHLNSSKIINSSLYT
jgi:hypothetical protein